MAGLKEVTEFISKNYDRYQKIYLTDGYYHDPAPIVLRYLDYSPQDFLAEGTGPFVYRHWIKKVGKIEVDNQAGWVCDSQGLFIVLDDRSELTRLQDQGCIFETIKEFGFKNKFGKGLFAAEAKRI